MGMKVLVVHCVYKYKGGEETVVAEEIKLLKSNEVEAELLEFNNYENTFFKLLMLPFNVQSYLKTRRKIRNYKPDIIHIHNLHFGASASVIYAIKKSKVPFVATLHNYRLICPSASLFHNGKPFLDSLHQNFPWSAVSKGVYRNSRLLTFWLSLSAQLHKVIGTWKACNKYIALTPFSKKIFTDSSLKIPIDKIAIKPNFCNLPSIVHVKRSAYFLYVGRLSHEKGVMLLLDTFSSLGYNIKIAGDGELKDTVVAYSSNYINIEFLGVLSKEKVFALLSECSALVFPSKWYEGMPLTIIEAFACGTPVISSKIGAMDSMVIDGYNGLHFQPGSRVDLLSKLHEWQDLKEDEREKYRCNARETYDQNYTPEKNAGQLLNIYDSVLKNTTKTRPKKLSSLEPKSISA